MADTKVDPIRISVVQRPAPAPARPPGSSLELLTPPLGSLEAGIYFNFWL